MNKFNQGKQQRFAVSLAVVIVSALACTVTRADGLANDYDAMPPLISTAGSNDRPNVLLMLDTSGSMNENKSGTTVGSNSETSKTVIARQAIAEIMSQFNKTANMGLMAFEPAPSFDYKRITGTGQAYEWSGQNLGTTSSYKIKRGYLYIPIGSIDPADTSAATVTRISDFKKRLGIDIITQPATGGYYNLFKFSNTTYLTSTDSTNKRLVSDGGTPLEGTYLSANEYFNGTLSSTLRDSSITGTNATWPKTNQCSDRDFAILLTDGLPSVNADGTACGSCTDTQYDNNTTKVEARAIALAAAGVKTYVIGIALGASGEKYLTRMAVAGGTDKALFASDLNGLLTALNGIFADIVNRSSSGTGAAVVANRGNGLSADFQALFTPEMQDSKQNIMKWGGTLQGFFVDENKLLREDTNANGLLDDYTVDRQLEFKYDAVKGQTLVYRKESSSPTDPTQISSTLTSDVEDIKSIWSARDRLSALTNLLTQRSYSASAATGRRIYTSVDGQTLLNFSVINPADLSTLDADEDTIRAQIAGLDTDIANSEANLYAATGILGTHISGTVAGAVSNLGAEIAGLDTGLDSAIASQQSALTAAQAAEAAALAARNAAQADATAAAGDTSAAQAILTAATADKTAADTAVTNATNARDTAQTALNTANTDVTNATTAVGTATTDLGTAQSAMDTAQGDVDTANTNATNATTAVTTAQATATAAATAVTSATADRDAAQTAVNNATTARDTAQDNVNAAQTVFDDAVTAEQDAHDAFDAAAGSFPPSSQPYIDAENAWNAAIADRDAASTDLADNNTALTNAVTALSTAQTTLTTEQGDLTAALSAQTTANTDLGVAQSDLTTAQGVLTTAQGNLTTATATRDAKQTALNTANSNLTAAQTAQATAQTTLTTAQTTLDTAVTTQTDAQTALNTAQADFDTATAAQTTADGALTTAQGVLDTASAATTSAAADLAYSQSLSNDLDPVTSWASDVAAKMTQLQTLLDAINQINSMTPAMRDALLTQIATMIAELQALISNEPALVNGGDPQFANLNALMAALLAELQTTKNLFFNGDATVNSIAEITSEIDTDMDSRESLQTALVNTQQQIDPIAYIKYMDDGIIGQTGDPDLTYTQRNDIVKWIRGEEVSGLRNRTIDYNGDGVTEVWRLADIVHSTPVVVGRPSGPYYSSYNDLTYRAFLEAKFNRRQVVYAGSNDGMLHAFNSGFWNDSVKGYVTALPGDTTSVQHPLGSELWAYIPKAALPHLQFVANSAYSHMFLVDGAPQTYDVNIFSNDTDHPNGWGSILVVNMRLGGGPFTVRVDEDGDGVDEDVVIRPSVMIFDVTNPEAEPTLIAEITDPDIGHTFGKPALIKNRVASTSGDWANPQVNRWLLVFGSGPTDIDTATSNQTAKLYAYDLNARELTTDFADNPLEITLETNAYLGDAVAQDWDGDFVDDVVYFGVNSGNAATSDGRMARLRLRSDQGASGWLSGASVSTLVNVDRTIIGTPTMKSDVYGRRWVYFGTGRVLAPADNASSQQQYLYGVMEPIDTSYEFTYAAASAGSLLDVSNIETYKSGKVTNGPSGVENFAQLVSYIHDNNDGWKRKLRTSGTNPSGRSDTHPAEYLESIFFAEYVPSSNQCKPEGVSHIYDLNYMTGTGYALNYLDTVTESSGEVRIVPDRDLGQGKVGDVMLLPSGDLVFHDSTGGVTIIEPTQQTVSLRRQSWRQIFDFGF